MRGRDGVGAYSTCSREGWQLEKPEPRVPRNRWRVRRFGNAAEKHLRHCRGCRRRLKRSRVPFFSVRLFVQAEVFLLTPSGVERHMATTCSSIPNRAPVAEAGTLPVLGLLTGRTVGLRTSDWDRCPLRAVHVGSDLEEVIHNPTGRPILLQLYVGFRVASRAPCSPSIRKQ